jgi:hypothetical protein
MALSLVFTVSFSCAVIVTDGAEVSILIFTLNSEEFPDAKYETRYLLSIIGLRNAHLYFNVIPGSAREHQFGTEISEKDMVCYITIKANLKSNLHWKQEQAKFLELLVPIIEKMNQKMK